jgi:hypothetical protein
MNELENSAIDDLPPDDAPGPETDLGKISELLARDGPEPIQPTDADDDDAAPAATDDPDPVETPEADPDPDLAADDADDSEPAKIDYDQVVPMPDGAESVTIGQLKDHYQGKADFESERETWTQRRTEQEGKHIIAKQGLMQLAQLVGNVNPQVLEYVQQQQAVTRQQEAASLLEVFPEWADANVKRAAAPKLKAVAEKLGFSEAEFAHISDHRQIRALHMLEGFLTGQEKAAAAKAAIKADLPKAQKTTRRKVSAAQRKAQQLERAKSGNASEKNAAISTLIRG